MKKEFDFESFKNKAIEQLKAGIPCWVKTVDFGSVFYFWIGDGIIGKVRVRPCWFRFLV